ncbi:chromate resistance protein ChrB domain-containing protein [Kiloniella laminariae]|uniref:chromate resistance protein ChrB domain-containing protein n=1 Tax=Kiloniella laminariae TaxID=454162 RepID=UPI00036D0D69|nr:sulfurtransferase/chromate resistance protein [Kiloniella laminariae]
MSSPTEITVAQLSRLIGTPNAPVLIDVRIDEDFEDDPRFIPGAFRHGFREIETLAPQLMGKSVVVVCQKGLKLSQGAAALLRHHGVNAESLETGTLGWSAAGLPSVPAKSIPTRTAKGNTLWVTRLRPKIDRIACPWLIRRFVDPSAQFLFVVPSQVESVAEKFDATPFDVDGVFWSHREEYCTFDTMVEEFGLEIEALKNLATIVRGADTNRHDLAPEAAGLLAASLGLSRMYRDDLAQLEAGMLLYDAFYRWARDATAEGHDWPAATTRSQERD